MLRGSRHHLRIVMRALRGTTRCIDPRRVARTALAWTIFKEILDDEWRQATTDLRD
jgi:hypothetical protein